MGNNPRSIVVYALEAVLDHGYTIDHTLDKSRKYHSLNDSDRAFVRLIMLTTLRRLGEIDYVINNYMNKSPKPRQIRALHILRMSVAQLLFLNTPPHAAVSTAVELAGEQSSTVSLKGLVNAVLRKVSRDGSKHLKNIDADRVNTPDWLWKKLNLAYGENITREIVKAFRKPAPLDLTLKDVSKADKWSKKLDAFILPNKTLRLFNAGQIEKLNGFTSGEWWVQDAAASFPARMINSCKNDQVLDLCAAPGGKTAQLSSQGANVIAVDNSTIRLKKLSKNLLRLKLNATLLEQDILKWSPSKKMDLILLDAPCSATGTIRRHPEVPWTRRSSDLKHFKSKQDELLDAATNLLSPGGKLVYTVCSLLPEEGVERINALIKRKNNISRESFDLKSLGIPHGSVNKYGDLQTLPCHWPEYQGLDGFFAACLRCSL
ncbi:MAG: MFS transporter [Rhodospirillaceae bacterium]|nr:MFS transporter [Rhodospirillaceae bacterium]